MLLGKREYHQKFIQREKKIVLLWELSCIYPQIEHTVLALACMATKAFQVVTVWPWTILMFCFFSYKGGRKRLLFDLPGEDGDHLPRDRDISLSAGVCTNADWLFERG